MYLHFTFQCTWHNKSITIQKVTNGTKTKIENVTATDCTIKLWCNFTDKAQLIDNTSVEPFELSKAPRMQQQETINLVNDKFKIFRSNVTTPSTNHETKVAPEKKDWPRYVTSEITVNPTKLITENGIINTTFRTESGSNTTVTVKTIIHKVDDDLTNNTTLIVVIVLIVTLCLLLTLVGTFYYIKRCRQKNNDANKIDGMEKIMLMPVPGKESQIIVANIKIDYLESYLKKTMVSSRNIENQFCVSGEPT
jgi:hypothetical protein